MSHRGTEIDYTSLLLSDHSREPCRLTGHVGNNFQGCLDVCPALPSISPISKPPLYCPLPNCQAHHLAPASAGVTMPMLSPPPPFHHRRRRTIWTQSSRSWDDVAGVDTPVVGNIETLDDDDEESGERMPEIGMGGRLATHVTLKIVGCLYQLYAKPTRILFWWEPSTSAAIPWNF